MKLTVRGDDLGYSEAMNYGYRKCIDEGILTSAELMIGMPGTEQAVEMLKDYSWIPVGWHVHICGMPSADPSLVKDLLDGTGELKVHISRGHPSDQSLYPQLKIEMTAELDRFTRYMGKKPDMVSNVDDQDDPYSRILRELVQQRHIDHIFRDFTHHKVTYHKWVHQDQMSWQIVEYPIEVLRKKTAWTTVQDQADHYDPMDFLNDVERLHRTNKTGLAVFHPGYVDEYILTHSTCNIARCKDVSALTDPAVRKKLDDYGVELITSSDYLYGTHKYRDYLNARNG